MVVVELTDSNQFMVVLRNDGNLNMSLNPQRQHMVQEKECKDENVEPEVMETREKSNVIKILKKTCSCGIWQEYNYPCSHAMAYFCKWEELSFPQFLKDHVHPYYNYKRMQQIFKNNIFPGERSNLTCHSTNPPSSG